MFLFRWIERGLVRWLMDRHGHGHAHQWMFYRCDGCRRLVSWHVIVTGGCACRESSKVRPAILTRAEKWRLLMLPWTVTPRPRRREAHAAQARAQARMAAASAARAAERRGIPGVPA